MIKWTTFCALMLIMLFPAVFIYILAIFILIALPYAFLTNLLGPNNRNKECEHS